LTEEQDARIASLREFSANARNWYGVLLTLAVVLFTAVQVRDQLTYAGLWGVVFAIVYQALYAVIRAAVSVKLGRSVIRVRVPPHLQYKGYLEGLDDQVRDKLKQEHILWSVGLRLGDHLKGWVVWTAAGCLPLMTVMVGRLLA
jgi:hypothetical protein